MIHESEAIVLSAKSSGEKGAVLDVFTEKFGRMRGFVRVTSKKKAALQIGNTLNITQRKRLETQLGTFTVELLAQPTARVLDNFTALQTTQYLCDLLKMILPEEHAYQELYYKTKNFLNGLGQPDLWQRLAFYELELLRTLGYKLSLSEESAVPCDAGTPLIYVSPKTGRAVSIATGKPYKDKLFTLPYIFGGATAEEAIDRQNTFRLTGYFLEKALHNPLPPKRAELLASF